MIPRTVRILVLCAVLGAVAGQAFGQDAVRLEYKFRPGELLRYKVVMNMKMDMQMSAPDASSVQMPPMRMQAVGIMRQRTKRVLPNGDAEVASAVESMKMTMGDKTEAMPAKKMPVTTMVISKNGVLKSVQGLDKVYNQFGGMQFFSPESFGQFAGFPEGELKAGDTWTQDIPFPMGGGSLRVSGKFLSANTKLGSYTVATLEQNAGGDISFDIPVPAPNSEASSTAANMGAKGAFLGDAKVYFSVEKGLMVRTDGKANIQMKMDFSGGPDGQQGAMNIGIDVNFQMFLLPGQAK